ncbi:MAG: hypothetical protein J6Q81_04025, partial [Lentisphaeria bacterium]|nr:hypothetical protein [Lentisphaeria bacterium]
FLPGMQPQAGSIITPPPTREPVKLFNEAEEIICNALKVNGPGSLDDLSQRTNLPAGVLAGTLMALEIRDIIAKSAGNIYSLK